MKGDIQLPNQSGKIDPRLEPSALARAANQRTYESRSAVTKPKSKQDSMYTRIRSTYRSLTGSR